VCAYFLLNAVWQIAAVAAVTALVNRLIRNGPAVYRHAVWVAALAAAILLPIATARKPVPAASLQVNLPAPSLPDAAAPAASAEVPLRAADAVPEPIRFSPTAALATVELYLLSVLYGLTRF